MLSPLRRLQFGTEKPSWRTIVDPLGSESHGCKDSRE
jgi:hypothetical protein